LVLVWQLLQATFAVGMWLAGFTLVAHSTKPLWQLEQSPLAGCTLSATLKVLAVAYGRVWNPRKGAAVVIGYGLTLIHTMSFSWQLEQLPVTPSWIMVDVGAGARKPLFGAAWGALPGTRPVGMLERWQLSQVVEVGRCEVVAGVLEGGITTMLLMPWKLAPVMLWPWHSAQLAVMPVWIKAELANVAVPVTGVVAILDPVPTWQLSQPRPRMGT
jgi:hypothetical protein